MYTASSADRRWPAKTRRSSALRRSLCHETADMTLTRGEASSRSSQGSTEPTSGSGRPPDCSRNSMGATSTDRTRVLARVSRAISSPGRYISPSTRLRLPPGSIDRAFQEVQTPVQTPTAPQQPSVCRQLDQAGVLRRCREGTIIEPRERFEAFEQVRQHGHIFSNLGSPLCQPFSLSIARNPMSFL